VRKILAYEALTPSLDDLRLPFWAGAPMYGPQIDAMATELALQVLRTYGPKWLCPWVLSSDVRHPLCGWPPDQPDLYTKQLQRGGALAVLMGHGDEKGLHAIRHQGRTILYGPDQVRLLDAPDPPAPPMIVFTCSSGNFTAAKRCMTKGFLLLAGGPVAAIGATEESHPLPNYYSGVTFLMALQSRPRRLGTMWLNCQRNGSRQKNFLIEGILRNVEGQIGMDSDVAKLKRDQPLLYALLGDPATRLHLPAKLEATVERGPDGWRWTATKPKDATRLHVGFRPPLPPIIRTAQPPDKATARRRHRQANAAFEFQRLADLPTSAPWQGHVRGPGVLRLVALGPKRLHATAFQLITPASASPATR